MIFCYDRISVKERIDIETCEHHDNKDVMTVVYFFMIKIILTIKKELAIDVIISY